MVLSHIQKVKENERKIHLKKYIYTERVPLASGFLNANCRDASEGPAEQGTLSCLKGASYRDASAGPAEQGTLSCLKVILMMAFNKILVIE